MYLPASEEPREWQKYSKEFPARHMVSFSSNIAKTPTYSMTMEFSLLA